MGRICQKVKLFIYPLNLAGDPSPVAQKGTRSKYRAATILKNPLLNTPFFDLAESCTIAYWLLPRVGLLVPIGPSKGALLAQIREPYWPE